MNNLFCVEVVLVNVREYCTGREGVSHNNLSEEDDQLLVRAVLTINDKDWELTSVQVTTL